MTREGPEEPEATQGSSKSRTGNNVTRERNEPRSGSKQSSGERSEPREREGSKEPEATQEPSKNASGDRREPREREGSEGADDIPLNIAGHEDRARTKTDDGGDTVLEFSEDELGADDGEVDETDSSESTDDEEDVEPVELLVQLAKDGEIDPWDIDIVAVTDKFLEVLDDRDLRTSGRALFYASVLLRMKSDELFAPDEPEEEELPPWEAPFADDAVMAGEDGGGHPPGFDPVENLEAEMERRLERKHARGKPETLDELVRELRSAERDNWWKESRSYDTSDSPSGYDRGVQELSYHAEDQFRVDDEPTSDDVTHTTHEEDIETVIDDVETVLSEHYENGRDEVLYAEIDETGGSRVMTYLALLFLAHRGQVSLEQDELFGDLWIQQVTVESTPDEAIAD